MGLPCCVELVLSGKVEFSGGCMWAVHASERLEGVSAMIPLDGVPGVRLVPTWLPVFFNERCWRVRRCRGDQVAINVCNGLAFLHLRRIVHMDIK